MADFRSRLQHKIDQHSHFTNANHSSEGALPINIGLDFGTTYTKVCYRIVGQDRTVLLPFDARVTDDEIFTLPSVVWVDEECRLYHPFDGRPTRSWGVRCFKMDLLGTPFNGEFASRIAARSSLPPGRVFHALTVFYLAKTLSLIMEAIKVLERIHLVGRSVTWSGNFGIPIDHYDSPTRGLYQRVINQVVRLVLSDRPIPSDLASLDSFCVGFATNGPAHDFHLLSELEATVVGFVQDRSTREGLYSVVDIGGGTVDAAGFSFHRQQGRPMVNFLSSHVAPLGNEVMKSNPGNRSLLLHRYRSQVAQMFVDSWKRVDIIRKDSARNFPCFLSGGGRHETSYTQDVKKAYIGLNLSRLSIPPVELRTFSRPTTIVSFGRAFTGDIGRYLLAYGLSLDRGNFPEIVGFPSVNERPVPFPEPPGRKSGGFSTWAGDYDK